MPDQLIINESTTSCPTASARAADDARPLASAAAAAAAAATAAAGAGAAGAAVISLSALLVLLFWLPATGLVLPLPVLLVLLLPPVPPILLLFLSLSFAAFVLGHPGAVCAARIVRREGIGETRRHFPSFRLPQAEHVSAGS